jgi:nucleotide-binding universal stress UspA family protein
MAERILCVVAPSLADASLIRSCSLARSSSAELVVACITGGGLRVTSLSGAFGDSEFVGMLAGTLDDDTPLPFRLGVDRLLAEATRVAAEHAVGMVVVPGELAARSVALTERLRVPVLLARPSRGTNILVALAGSPQDERVLATGHQLSASLGAGLVVVHNQPPRAAAPDPRQLERIAEIGRLFGAIRTIVTRASCSVRGVLEAARAEAADVIVVGVDARSWLRREVGSGLPERVAREGGRSVLMVPVRRYEA